MDPDNDTLQYYIEDTLLLKFLIIRYTEMLQIKEPKLVPVWAGLGLVALHQNTELKRAFETLVSSDSYTAQEILTSSVDLFVAELARLAMVDTTDCPVKKIERRPLSSRTARKFLFWAWGEGRKMGRERCLEYYSIWEVVSWLGLTSDEHVTAFEERCRFSESPVGEKLRDGLDVVKAAIFKRRLKHNSFQADMLKSAITNR